MRNNAATFSHPETIRKIKAALWIARIEAAKLAKRRGSLSGKAGTYASEGRQYVQNKKGNNYLRVSVYRETDGGYAVHIWGDQSRDVTGLVMAGAIKAH